MESRQLRLLAALTAILLALTALLWFGDTTADPYDPNATAEVVDPIDITLATRLRIVQSLGDRDATLEMEKADGIWRVTAPYQADTDPGAVVDVLDAVRESTKGIPVSGEPSGFGLEPPAATVTVWMEDGSERVLAVGNVTPDGAHTYAVAKDGTYAAVPGRPGDPLLRRPNEYRDHRVFRYEPGDVTRIAIESDLGRLEATKFDAGWFLTGYSRADLDALDNWVVDFLNLRVDLFLDLEAVRPEDPRYTVEVETSAGVQQMYVGRDTPYGPLIFFRDGLNGTMDPGLLDMLSRGPRDVGAADAFPFDDDVTRITLSGARDAVLEPSGDTWAGADDAERVLAVIQTAQLAYKADAPTWTGPELTVTLDGATRHVIEVGPPDAEGFRAVRDTGGGSPVRVPVDELEDLFAAP
ncbi:MAG: DUF4340 domain-containing protein [Alphaproteobacteria bacterium]|nr:DUF4340 domain-containing protein [Alphaproteobacteria bacterium]